MAGCLLGSCSVPRIQAIQHHRLVQPVALHRQMGLQQPQCRCNGFWVTSDQWSWVMASPTVLPAVPNQPEPADTSMNDMQQISADDLLVLVRALMSRLR